MEKLKIYSNYRGDDWINPYIDFVKNPTEADGYLDYQVMRDLNEYKRYSDKIHNLYLIEPRTTSDLVDSPNAYEFVEKNYQLFDNIFTHDSVLLQLPNAHRMIWGGVWHWSDKQKTKNLSMISSDKQHCPLHIDRYNLANYIKDNHLGDTYGTFDGGKRASTAEAHEDYRFAIAIENYIDDYWFTEKICNCFANKVVPIYLGAKKINEFFNMEGIIQVNSIEEIKALLKSFDYEKEYEKRLSAIEDNYVRVKEFECPFTYLYNNYADLLTGKRKELSIIIPVFNQEELVVKCLDSIPKDDRVEIIVIDDCSTDNSYEILKQYPGIELYHNKQNEGPGYSRNLGIDVAKGKYVMFLDSDDYMFTDNLFNFFDLFKNNYDLIFYALEENNGHIVDVTRDNKEACGTIKMIKKDFIGKLRFPQIAKAEDKYFHKWLMAKGPLVYHSRITLVHYNYPREGSITNIFETLNYEIEEKEEKYKYLVEATDLFKEKNLEDRELGRVPEQGERWIITKDRLDKLTWDNIYSEIKPFVYVIDREKI